MYHDLKKKKKKTQANEALESKFFFHGCWYKQQQQKVLSIFWVVLPSGWNLPVHRCPIRAIPGSLLMGYNCWAIMKQSIPSSEHGNILGLF